MHGVGRGTGKRGERRFRWFKKRSPRPQIEGHSQPHGDELSPGYAKVLTSSGLLRAVERYFTIERRRDVTGKWRDGYRARWRRIAFYNDSMLSVISDCK
jgi:hypothetical protein